VLFSMWDQGCDNTMNSNECPESQRAKIIECGPTAACTRFGGEGTGAKSYFFFNDWKVGKEYKFAMFAQPDVEGKALYSGYFWSEELGWTLISRILVNIGKANWAVDGLYNFLEMWTGADPWDLRDAQVGPAFVRGLGKPNDWFQIMHGTWDHGTHHTEQTQYEDGWAPVGAGDAWEYAMGGDTRIKSGQGQVWDVGVTASCPLHLSEIDLDERADLLPTGYDPNLPKDVCEWENVRGEYGGGCLYEGGYCPWYTLEQAKQKCTANGDCYSITCYSDTTCTLRESPDGGPASDEYTVYPRMLVGPSHSLARCTTSTTTIPATMKVGPSHLSYSVSDGRAVCSYTGRCPNCPAKAKPPPPETDATGCWLKNKGKYSGGYARGESTNRDEASALARCQEMGENSCKAVTCSSPSRCTVRSSKDLGPSGGEYTFTPFHDCAYSGGIAPRTTTETTTSPVETTTSTTVKPTTATTTTAPLPGPKPPSEADYCWWLTWPEMCVVGGYARGDWSNYTLKQAKSKCLSYGGDCAMISCTGLSKCTVRSSKDLSPCADDKLSLQPIGCENTAKYLAAGQMCWKKVDGQKATGFAAGNWEQYTEDAAKELCLSMKMGSCEAVTCDSSSALCTVRTSKELKKGASADYTLLPTLCGVDSDVSLMSLKPPTVTFDMVLEMENMAVLNPSGFLETFASVLPNIQASDVSIDAVQFTVSTGYEFDGNIPMGKFKKAIQAAAGIDGLTVQGRNSANGTMADVSVRDQGVLMAIAGRVGNITLMGDFLQRRGLSLQNMTVRPRKTARLSMSVRTPAGSEVDEMTEEEFRGKAIEILWGLRDALGLSGRAKFAVHFENIKKGEISS